MLSRETKALRVELFTLSCSALLLVSGVSGEPTDQLVGKKASSLLVEGEGKGKGKGKHRARE